jgi:hypothetical protein
MNRTPIPSMIDGLPTFRYADQKGPAASKSFGHVLPTNRKTFTGLALGGFLLIAWPIHLQHRQFDPALLLVQEFGASAVVLVGGFVVYWARECLTNFLGRLARRSLSIEIGPEAQ